MRPDRREELGAVTHIDGTARVQVRRSGREPALIEGFGRATGTPVVLNTSFDNNAEPIVQTVADAVTTLTSSSARASTGPRHWPSWSSRSAR